MSEENSENKDDPFASSGWSKHHIPSKEEMHEYDPFCDPGYIAAKHGMIVVLPEPNQLFVDIDTEEQHDIFCKRFDCFLNSTAWIDENVQMKVTPSASGLPHRHITLTFDKTTFTNLERLAYQAALGDDPVRIYLNGIRIAAGFEPPITFFEKY